MWPHRYFPDGYFAPRYFAKVGAFVAALDYDVPAEVIALAPPAVLVKFPIEKIPPFRVAKTVVQFKVSAQTINFQVQSAVVRPQVAKEAVRVRVPQPLISGRVSAIPQSPKPPAPVVFLVPKETVFFPVSP